MSELPESLSHWIVTQRWFSGKSRAPNWRTIGGFDLPVPPDSGVARISVGLLLDEAEPPVLYQVPLSERRSREPELESAFVDEISTPGGTRFRYDGTRDPVAAVALLRFILDEAAALPVDRTPGIAARGHTAPGTPPREIVSSRVLSGEQSNTSIIFETTGIDGSPAVPVICKVYRSVHHGENPDVSLTSALSGAGSPFVPASIGHITGQWQDSGQPTGLAHGHLAFAQEFLPGVEDAWRVALHAAETGESFSERAHALGDATARIHLTLAAALPTRGVSSDDITATIEGMRRRLDIAAADVPQLTAYRDVVDTLYGRLESSTWPRFQRIHGDFHLGQVLAVPGRGWVAVDFEGEPLRSMAERVNADSPLRDVAGMLRSFDYVAGSVANSGGDAQSAAGWAEQSRAAFLEGYVQAIGATTGIDAELLDAFELDKAIYEVMYEARNRPAWLPIPLSAVARLVERASASLPSGGAVAPA